MKTHKDYTRGYQAGMNYIAITLQTDSTAEETIYRHMSKTLILRYPPNTDKAHFNAGYITAINEWKTTNLS